MKKTDVLVKASSPEELPNFISEENKHLFPKDMQIAFDFINSRPIVFPKRYLRAQKGNASRKVHQLYKEKPNLSPKIVLLTLIAPLPDFIPADMMQEICKHILECWQIEQKKGEKKVA